MCWRVICPHIVVWCVTDWLISCGVGVLQRKLSVSHHELKAKTDGLWGKAGGQYHAADGRSAQRHKQVEANFRGSEVARVLN
jgi:hypothetical protein